MPASEAKLRATHKYDKKTYYQIGVRFKRSEYNSIKEAIAKSGESFNAFVVNAVIEKLSHLGLYDQNK